MVCPKCGAEAKEGYCLRCGTLVTGSLPTQMDASTFDIKKDIKDEDELVIFVGSRSDKIIFNPVNFAAAFFGPMWLAYRKCYLLSFLLPILEFLIIFLIENFFSLPTFLYGIFNFLFYLMAGNAIYLMHAHRKIRKIKRKHMDYYLLLERKGGVSVVYSILYPIFLSIITFVLVFGYYRLASSYYKVGDLTLFAWNYELNSSLDILTRRKEDATCNISINKITKKGMSEKQYAALFTNSSFKGYTNEKMGKDIWKKLHVGNREYYIYDEPDSFYFALFSADSEKDYKICKKEFANVRESFKFKKEK